MVRYLLVIASVWAGCSVWLFAALHRASVVAGRPDRLTRRRRRQG